MRDQSTAGHPAPGTATATTFREPEDPSGTADPTNRTDPTDRDNTGPVDRVADRTDADEPDGTFAGPATDRDLTEEDATSTHASTHESTHASTEARADAAMADASTADLARADAHDAAGLDPDEGARYEAERDEGARYEEARDEEARDEAVRDEAVRDEADTVTPAAASTTLDERVDGERLGERVENERIADGEGRADDLSDGELSERVPGSDDEAASVDENRYVVDDGVATDDGTAPSTVEERGALWAGPETDAMRERWREIQLRFVDDPRSAADEAAGLVDEAAQTLVAAIDARRSELTRSHPAGAADAAEPGAPEQPRPEGETEQLRLAVQRYREFLDQVLKL